MCSTIWTDRAQNWISESSFRTVNSSIEKILNYPRLSSSSFKVLLKNPVFLGKRLSNYTQVLSSALRKSASEKSQWPSQLFNNRSAGEFKEGCGKNGRWGRRRSEQTDRHFFKVILSLFSSFKVHFLFFLLPHFSPASTAKVEVDPHQSVGWSATNWSFQLPSLAFLKVRWEMQ